MRKIIALAFILFLFMFVLSACQSKTVPKKNQTQQHNAEQSTANTTTGDAAIDDVANDIQQATEDNTSLDDFDNVSNDLDNLDW